MQSTDLKHLPHAEEGREQEPRQQRADNPDQDIEHGTLLRIGVHDEASNPPQEATHNNPQNKIHL
jgi:hypothetical protein